MELSNLLCKAYVLTFDVIVFVCLLSFIKIAPIIRSFTENIGSRSTRSVTSWTSAIVPSWVSFQEQC